MKKEPFYFYHIANKDANIYKDGLLSLEYLYDIGRYDDFDKYSDKYRDRLVGGWDIYPNRDADTLSREELLNGIKQFRKGDSNRIYFFRYPPYVTLHKDIASLLKRRYLYRINLDDPKLKKYIKSIHWGYKNSNSNNAELKEQWYREISIDDYFGQFDPKKKPLFSTLWHISVETKNGYIPPEFIERVPIPGTIEDVKAMETIQESNILNEAYNSKDYTDYMTNGSSDYILQQYKRMNYPFKISVGLPNYINRNDFEKEIDRIGKNKYNKFWKTHKGYTGNSPFKFYYIISIEKEELMNIVFSNVNGLERLGVVLYQYNFSTENRRYSILLITSKNELKSAYFIMHTGKLEKINIKTKSFLIDENAIDEVIEESSKIPDEIPDDIKGLLKQLNSYDYGYVKNGKPVKGMNNFFEDYKSLSISEFEKYKIGVCWDYVHYEADWFKKHKYRYETFYIQVQDKDNDCPSHTYLVFYLPGSTTPYYFESSWGKYQGIEKFKSITELHNTIKQRHIDNAESKCDPKTYFREKYDAASKSWEHLSCGDYMVKVSKGKIKIDESITLPLIGSFIPYSFPEFEPVKEKIQIMSESVSNPKMYFISSSNMDNRVLKPKVPSNYFTKNGYEDNKTKRVCFAPSIDQCLMGLSQNLTGKEFYVHIPIDDVKGYHPSTKEVPDSKITGEIWVKEDVRIKCIGKIKVIKDKGTDGIPFTYGSNTAELYEWDWKWEKRSITESSKLDKNIKYIDIASNKQAAVRYLKQIHGVYTNYIDNYNGELAIDKDKDLIVGQIFIGTEEKNKGFISGLWVRKSYRNMGIGSRLINDAIKKYHGIDLTVHKNNQIAIDMYKKRGFFADTNYKDKEYYWMKLENGMIDESHDEPVLSEEELEDLNTTGRQLADEMIGMMNRINNIIEEESKENIFYGLPELKKYPMPDEKHVLSAIRFFNYVSPENEEELAKNIKKKMKEYNISSDHVGDKNRLKKYIKEDATVLSEFEFDNFDDIQLSIVFDLGSVLVENTFHYLDALYSNKNIPDHLANRIYSYIMNTFEEKKDYLEYCSRSEYYRYMTNNAPKDITKYIPTALKVNQATMRKLPYTDELLQYLSKRHKLYYLSNWSKWSIDELIKNKTFDFLKYFEGGLFSGNAGCMKPDHKIYKKLFAQYKLDPKKCIFFDDNKDNVKAAEECGMSAILFNKDYTPQWIMDNL